MRSGTGPGPTRVVLAGASLPLLLAHARLYAFTTDDAFISFRYARNLAEGSGLVFNPGAERVEGYTNFLWVLLLAAADFAGVGPERAAALLSTAATVGLWSVVAAFLLRRARPEVPAWIVPLPLFALAATRSVAVWSTSGLETRLFEFWVVWGVLRLLREREDDRLLPLSGLLFGLAALTRPEGILLGGCALGAALAVELPRTRAAWSPWIARGAGFLAPVAAHVAFRLAYYGAWLPNTYAAKVGNRAWWDMGFDYLLAFGIEYGAWIWLPLVAASAVAVARTNPGRRLVLVVAAVVVPFVAYVAAIGGDHFEYRPLDLVFPFAFLLLGEGAAALGSTRRGALAVGLLAVAVFGGLTWLPARSHLGFPESYRPGFPGRDAGSPAAASFLDPAADPLYRLPGLRSLAESHRARLARMTEAFVGIRQEEHRAFLESLRPQAERLHRLVAEGRIPPDLHIALSSVGIVPFASGLPTLDRLGLTDAVVARSPAVSDRRAMAHERRDTREYARRIGVDLSAVRAATILFETDDPFLLPALAAARGAGLDAAWAEVEPGAILAGTLPQGTEATRRAFPGLPLRPLAEPGAWDDLVARCLPPLEEARRRSGGDPLRSLALAQALLAAGRAAEARSLLEPVAASRTDWVEVWKGLAGARALTGDLPGARAAIAGAIEAARRQGGDARELEAIASRLR